MESYCSFVQLALRWEHEKWTCKFVRNSVQIEMISFLKLIEFAAWYDTQTPKIRAQIAGWRRFEILVTMGT